MTKQETAAREVLQTLPLVMRTIGPELRKSSGEIPSPVHFGILIMLMEGPLNLSDLARQHNVSLPTASNSVTTLVQRGLVERRTASHDRRQVIIEVTPAGREMLQTLRARAEKRVAEVLASLSDAELDQLSAGLAVLRKAFPEPFDR